MQSNLSTSSLDQVDLLRIDATRGLDGSRRSQLGQFLTSKEVARFSVGMFQPITGDVRLLDAGAGVGSLTAAFVQAACRQVCKPRSINAVVVEVDNHLVSYLERTMSLCHAMCDESGIIFSSEVIEADFILHSVQELRGELFAGRHTYSHALLNPPYRKIQSTSRARMILRSLGIETTNLYTAFLELSGRSLDDNGELVAITPRSFCNGIYFREFRRQFTSMMRFDRFHAFNSRTEAFQHDGVLQENVIFHATRGGVTEVVTITTSNGPSDDCITMRNVPYDQFIYPNDSEIFIHITPDDLGTDVAQRITSLTATLKNIGAEVSTGRVVEFRSREYLRSTPSVTCVPLIYPRHFSNGRIAWPHATSAKPNAILDVDDTRNMFVRGGPYVLVKRFSSKEERHRVVATVYDVESTDSEVVAFENHINFYHNEGKPLPKKLAFGLCAFLNSTLVDNFFRQFSGSTQVNATDLRNLPYPTVEQLERLGKIIENEFPSQDVLDDHIEHELFAKR